MARSETTFTVPAGLSGPLGLVAALLAWVVKDLTAMGTSRADRASAIAFCQSELGNALARGLADRLDVGYSDEYPLLRLLERLDIDVGGDT